MKRAALSVALVLGTMVLAQACASSSHNLTFEPGSIDTGKYVRKVDQFVVIADGSLSMADRSRGQQKFSISDGFLVSLNQTIPDLDYAGGLRTFGRGLCQSEGKTVSIVDVTDYLASPFGDGITRYECPNGPSPLNLALDAAGGDLGNKTAPTAIIVVSDGLDMNQKEIQAAKALKTAFGDAIDIYAVQVGHSKKGRTMLEQVVAEGGDGYVKSASELTSADAMAQFVIDVFLWPDEDGDGVPNHLDKCPDTPKGVEVDTVGCPLDSDGDGVPDYLDKCPGTPQGVAVDASGCPIDSDGDGVPDHLDKCPGTPRGVPVDDTGCPVKGVEVAGDEWFVRGRVLFDLNRATIKPEAAEVLLQVANFLRKNQQYVVEIQGNTDSTGPLAWNMKLSEERAEAVKNYLEMNGVGAGRLTTKGFGPNEPIAPNNTAEGRAKNRRVDFKPTTR